jgi:hypothetical protein
MFRGDDGFGAAGLANTPMYSFDNWGAFFDGGQFIGSTLEWPAYTEHTYPPFILWVQDDLPVEFTPFVVESTSSGSPAGQASAITKFLDRSGKASLAHPGLAREAFGFYADSRLYLGSFRNDLGDDRGQAIEWEGYRLDDNRTRLRVVEPSALRDVFLPDASGTAVVAPDGVTAGPVFWSKAGPTGDEVCRAAGLSCVGTTKLGAPNFDPCDEPTSGDGYFLAFCRR